MIADAEGLDKDQSPGIHALAVINLLQRHGDILLICTFPDGATHGLVIGAAVDETLLAGITLTAVKVGIHGDDHALLQTVGVVLVDIHDLTGIFVTGDLGILGIQERAQVSADIRAADTAIEGADDGMAGGQLGDLLFHQLHLGSFHHLAAFKFAGRGDLNAFHFGHLICSFLLT